LYERELGKMEQSGHFGHWFVDEFGLPAYEYTCNQELDPKARYFTTGGSSTDHWHQLGNDHLNALAHNDGSIEVVDSTRGLQWICRRDPRHRQPGGGIAIIQDVDEGTAPWSDLFSQASYSSRYRRVFGAGYYRKISQRKGLKLDHVIFPPFSDDPVLISELNIVNNSDMTKNLMLYDYWSVNIRGISSALIYFDSKRKTFSKSILLNVLGKLLKYVSYALHLAPEQSRDRFSSKLRYEAKYVSQLKTVILKSVFKGRKKPARNQHSKHNYYPKAVFLSALDDSPIRISVTTKQLLDHEGRLQPHKEVLQGKLGAKDSPCLCLGSNMILKPKDQKKLTFLFGYADEEQLPDLVNKYRRRSPQTDEAFPLLKESSLKWASNLLEFSCNEKQYSWLTREAKWNSYYTRSATLFDEYFENHLFPQGGAYNYLQGLQGVTRDFMMFTMPMVYMHPALAREMLEYTMRLMTPDGRLPYCTYGFGMEGGAFVHNSPSDLPLSLLWGLSEYLFATRDFSFLKKKIPFYPKEKGMSSTVYERAKLAVHFLLDRVGFGEHGLIKSGDGDWNDGISTMVRNRRKFVRYGESMYNSGFALYVLPRISLLLEKQGDKNLAEKVEAVWNGLLKACLASWNGNWFYRGWDGSGNPIGDRNVFLEPLTWLLISESLPRTYADQLIKNLHSILDRPSPFGQFVEYPPLRTLLNYLEEGWDVNGGTWFAMNSLLVWGYSKYDPKKALDALMKNSLKRHAEVYPDTWYGIWSGPDAFNASYSSRPGETYYHLATPATDFPVMNLNLHANFLGALVKMAGIEPTIDGLTIRPSLPFKEFNLRTPILDMKTRKSEIEGSYERQVCGDFTLRMELPETWKEVDCYIDDIRTPVKRVRGLPIVQVEVDSKERRFKFKFVHRIK
jgi:hypothetical protein